MNELSVRPTGASKERRMVRVDLAERSYDILIHQGLIDEAGAEMRRAQRRRDRRHRGSEAVAMRLGDQRQIVQPDDG